MVRSIRLCFYPRRAFVFPKSGLVKAVTNDHTIFNTPAVFVVTSWALEDVLPVNCKIYLGVEVS